MTTEERDAKWIAEALKQGKTRHNWSDLGKALYGMSMLGLCIAALIEFNITHLLLLCILLAVTTPTTKEVL